MKKMFHISNGHKNSAAKECVDLVVKYTDYAWFEDFDDGYQYFGNKVDTSYVRCARAF